MSARSLFRSCMLLVALMGAAPTFAEEAKVVLDKAPVDLANKPSLQRGAKYFMNYCVGCHSLQYMRYNGLAKDLGIVDSKGEVDTTLMESTLVPKGQKVTDYIVNSMPKEDAAKWFGIAPPDLTLEARVRGADWIYTYLRAFYLDPKKPTGVNNLVFPDVAMPDVLVNEHGIYTLAQANSEHKTEGYSKKHEENVTSMLMLQQKGRLTPAEYDHMAGDITNFLVYAAEPVQLKRQHMGVWVLVFLVVFFLFALLLKREYWKDVH